MSNQIIVYSSNDCIECTYLKKVLEEKGVPFEVRNISENQLFQKEVEKFGFLGVPVTVVGEKAVKGLSHELIELIEEHRDRKMK